MVNVYISRLLAVERGFKIVESRFELLDGRCIIELRNSTLYRPSSTRVSARVVVRIKVRDSVSV